MTNKILEQVEQAYLKKDIPQFSVGDSVDVHTRIVEGDKERIQVFSGTVIMKKGRGINETFTVRRIVNNEGVERIFPLHSPFISKVVVKRGGETRRAKLFYLRERVGKAVKLTEKQRAAGAGKKEGGDGAVPPEKPGAAATASATKQRELAGAAAS
jgi:large subunit ribosomal protein L19